MGAKSSHSHSHGADQAGRRMYLPSDNPPYPGPPVKHSFMKVEVTITSSFTRVASNVDQVYPTIVQMLGQGQQLLTFCHIPGCSSVGIGSFNLPYLAIFRDRDPTRSPQSLLQVVKSTMHTEYFITGLLGPMHVESDKAGVYAAIQEKAACGARLICVEMTGQRSIGSYGGGQVGDMVPVLGVDVFFEAPPVPGPQQFVYELVSVPLRRIPGYDGVRVECDWMGVLRSKLNQGWRLVEIFLGNYRDQGEQSFRNIVTFNTQWFFEKPVARLHDSTPVWEACFGELFIQFKATFIGVKAKTDWDGYITAMGDRGWELACIVDTPEIRRSGFTNEQKCLLFFQRPILPPVDSPPAYDPNCAQAGRPARGTEVPHQGAAPAPGFVVPPEGWACGGKEQEALGREPLEKQ